jgi:TonB-linked SusC/RagA family outer membrane protein
MENLLKKLVVLICFLSMFFSAFAQNTFKVRGAVTNQNGEVLLGAIILEKGTTNATLTNENGEYELTISSPGKTLVYSYLGALTQELKVNNRTLINVTLQENQQLLDEVVVTALGISREKKALGYAVQDIKGSDIDGHVSNFSSALSGKVAGVTVNTNSTVGGHSRVVIRGESSLNYQANQPLYVIDGIPVGNDAVQNHSNADYGNSSAEFNPDDVESISVLKGAAASALYGSRAANGVIMITTKSGKSQKGLGISYSGSFSRETPLRLSQLQRLFGQGNNGVYEGSNFGYSNGGLYPDGINDSYDESWGPRFDGKPRVQFDSLTDNGNRAGDVYLQDRGNPIATPWVAHPDNLKDFFDSGYTRVHNVAISNASDKGSFRASYTNHDQEGLTPNNKMTRNTFNINSTYQINKWVNASFIGNYIKTKSTNRPDLGYGRETPMYFFIWLPQSNNINSYKNYWTTGMEGIRQFQGNYGENHNNPYFYQYENTSEQNKDKFFGNLKFDVKLNDRLKFMLRGGTDFYSDFRPRKMAVTTADYPEGFYQETKITFQENNFDGLLTYNTTLNKDISLIANLGANQMDRQQRTSINTANSLIIPGLYSLGNSKERPSVSAYGYHKRINSVYGNVQLDYKRAVFLDLSGRNDWSSTLPEDKNSYFYPSVTASVLINEMAKLPSYIDMLKIRGGYAQVGNDTDPYNLRTSYSYGGFYGNYALISEESALKNKNLKPELITTIEGGIGLMMFNNRLSADLSWYQSDSKDQILNLQATPTSGYGSQVINAGKLRNTGFELVLGATPVKLSNGFEWNVNVNFATNRGKVLELAEGLDELVVSAPGEDAKMVAKVGERVGQLYGPGFERVKDGPMKGEIIIGSNGLPVMTEEPILLGNVNPDWTAGIYNNFSYKGFSLSCLFDIRQGGVFVSRTLNKGIGSGQLVETEIGRGARQIGTEYDDPYYLEGAAQLPDGTYVPNLTIYDGTYSQGVYGTDARGFHKNYYDHNSEAQKLDASFVKLRELKFGYQFPQKMLQKVHLKNAGIYLFGRDLLLFTDRKNKHIDPENAMANTGNGLVLGFENLSIPTSKSIGIQLNLSF